MLNKRQNLRLTYYSAISRPGFYELIPHTGGDPDADYQEVGNPYLKRVTAENFDLRYELFPKALDQFLAGIFYKRINNPIEYTLEKSGLNYVLKADNFGTGYNYGFELDITKYLRNFGIRANYTFTNSQITTTKIQDYRDAQGFLTNRTVLQSRPLQGQSKNIGNLSFLYKQPENVLMPKFQWFTPARVLIRFLPITKMMFGRKVLSRWIYPSKNACSTKCTVMPKQPIC